MHIDKHIYSRLEGLKRRIETFRSHVSSFDELAEAEKLCREADRLLPERERTSEASGHRSHPLGQTPFLNTKILFLLNRAEQLLESADATNSSLFNGRPVSSENLIYPSIKDSVARTVIAWLVHRKGLRDRRTALYDQPTLIEVLYLRVPSYLEPIVRRLLPKKRHMWEFRPKR